MNHCKDCIHMGGAGATSMTFDYCRLKDEFIMAKNKCCEYYEKKKKEDEE